MCDKCVKTAEVTELYSALYKVDRLLSLLSSKDNDLFDNDDIKQYMELIEKKIKLIYGR